MGAPVAPGDDPRLDETELDAFYTRYGPEAYGLALGISRSAPVAERITFDAFLETWRSLDGCEWVEDGRKHLLAAVHRRAAAIVRDAYPQPKRLACQAGLLPGWLVLQRETAWGALSLLSDIEREVVELAYFGRYTLDEVADRLRLTPAVADEHLQAALVRLRESIGLERAESAGGTDEGRR